MASAGLLPKYAVLVAVAALTLALVGLGSRGGLAVFTAQTTNPGNTFTTAASFATATPTPTATVTPTPTSTPTATATPSCTAGDTGFMNPTSEAADTGGDGDGFELNPSNAFTNGSGYATNNDGDQDRHSFYDYGISFGASCVVTGIEVRLAWWLDDIAGTNSLRVELSWDTGSTWTSPYEDTQETISEHTAVLGGSSDTWGRSWTATELNDTNFRLHVESLSTDSSRDFFLDWVPVKVYYGP